MPGDRKSQGPERRSGSPRSASGADRHDRSRRNDNQSGQEAQQLTATTQSSAHPSEKYPSYLTQGSGPYHSPYPDPLDRYGPHLSQNPAPYQSRYPNPGSSPQTSERYSPYLPQGSAANPSHGYPSNQPQRQFVNFGPEQLPATSGARQMEKRLQPESLTDNPWTEGEVATVMHRGGHPNVDWEATARTLPNVHDADACHRKWERVKNVERSKEANAKAKEKRKSKKEGEQDEEEAPRKRQQKP